MSETTVRTILRQKDSHIVWTISANARVAEAASIMARRNIGALLVEDYGRILGIISERECVRKILARHLSPEATPVREVMERTLIGVSPSTSVDQCFSLMTEYRVRYIAVVEDDSLSGFLSIGDIVSSVIDDREFALDELSRYLHGPYCTWNVPLSVSWSPGQIQVLKCTHSVVNAPKLEEIEWGSESCFAVNG